MSSSAVFDARTSTENILKTNEFDLKNRPAL